MVDRLRAYPRIPGDPVQARMPIRTCQYRSAVTAGLAGVLEDALACARKQGFVSLFAGFPPDTRVPFDPNLVHYSEVRLTGSQNASVDQYRRVLQVLPRLPEIDTITTHRFPLDDAAQAYEVRLRNEGLKSMVLGKAAG